MALPLVITPGDVGHISDHEEIHDLLQYALSPFEVALDGSGTFAARPAAGVAGRYYLATDTNVLYRDTGAAWVEISSYLTAFAISLLDTAPTVASLTVPACRVGKSANQSIPDATDTVITFDVETGALNGDNDGMHSTSVNTSRITVNRDGYYIVGTSLAWASNAVGVRIATLRKNGSTFLVRDDRDATAGSNFMHVSCVAKAVDTDYFEVEAHQTSGGALNATTNSSFWVAYLGGP